MFSLAVRVMKGMVKPINRSAKARDTMNLWNRCRRNLVDLRITVTSTAFDRMMINAVTSLKMVFGDASNTENSSGSQSDIVNFFLGKFHAQPFNPGCIFLAVRERSFLKKFSPPSRNIKIRIFHEILFCARCCLTYSGAIQKILSLTWKHSLKQHFGCLMMVDVRKYYF